MNVALLGPNDSLLSYEYRGQKLRNLFNEEKEIFKILDGARNTGLFCLHDKLLF